MEKIAQRVPSFAGQLELVVVSVTGLAAKESKADPYVTVHVLSASNPAFPQLHGKTQVLKRNTEPAWNESFSFDFGSSSKHDHKLRLEVWDYNSIMRDKFLGQAELALEPGEKLQEGVEAELELPLGQREGKSKETVSGVVKIKAKLAIDYHRMRSEQKEEEEKLVEQVQLTRNTAETLIASFKSRASGSSQSIGKPDFFSVYAALDAGTLKVLTEQIASADDLFNCLDVNHDGYLDLEELLFGISTLATGTLDDKAELVFKAMDLDDSGSLSRSEVKRQCETLFKAFCAYTKKTVNNAVYKKYRQYLPEHQIKPLLDSLAEPLKQQLTVSGVTELFLLGDTDGDNSISLDEWRELVKKSEMAQWLVSPETYVAKVNAIAGPKIEALIRSM